MFDDLVKLCPSCNHLAYDIAYTDEDRQNGHKQASGFGHSFAGVDPCKCGCIQTPEITRMENRIKDAQKSLERLRKEAQKPWAPVDCL